MLLQSAKLQTIAGSGQHFSIFDLLLQLHSLQMDSLALQTAHVLIRLITDVLSVSTTDLL